jgi:ribonuclease P protein component
VAESASPPERDSWVNGDSASAREAVPRRGRLTRAAEFDAVTQLGRAVSGRYLTLRYRRAEGGTQPRVGYAVPRRVGGAVDRNGVKRRLREAVARHEHLLRPGTDYVLIARPGLAAAAESQGFAWLAGQVEELLQEAAEVSDR